MKCPLCKKEAKEAMYRPGKFVCKCTGVLEDVDVLSQKLIQNSITRKEIKESQDIVNKAGGRVLKYHPNMTIKLKVQKNKTNREVFKSSSYLFDVMAMPGLKQGSLSMFIDNIGSNDASYIMAANMISNDVLIFDPTKGFSKYIKSLGKVINSNSCIDNSNTVEDVFGEINTNIDKYQGIIILDYNFILTEQCIKDGKVNSLRKTKMIEQELVILNTKIRENSAAILFFTPGVPNMGPLAQREIPSSMNMLNQRAELVTFITNIKKTTENRIVFNIRKNRYKSLNKFEVYLKNDLSYDNSKELFELSLGNVINTQGRRYFYMGNYSLEVNNSIIKKGELLGSKRDEVFDALSDKKNQEAILKDLKIYS